MLAYANITMLAKANEKHTIYESNKLARLIGSDRPSDNAKSPGYDE